MNMIRQQGPCEAASVALRNLPSQSVEKILPISIVMEDLSPLDSAQQYMLHRSRRIASCFPGHDSLP